MGRDSFFNSCYISVYKAITNAAKLIIVCGTQDHHLTFFAFLKISPRAKMKTIKKIMVSFKISLIFNMSPHFKGLDYSSACMPILVTILTNLLVIGIKELLPLILGLFANSR